MNGATKPVKLSKFQVILMSLKYFAALSTKKVAIVTLILGLAFIKIYLKYSKNDIENFHKEKSKKPKEMIIFYICMAIFGFLRESANFMTDFIFEKQLTPYAGNIAVKIMGNIFKSNNRDIYELNGSNLEYLILEGSKSMAKICRFMLMTLFCRVIQIFLEIKSLSIFDKSDGKFLTSYIIGSIILITLFLSWQIIYVSRANKINMQVSYKKEKSINENMENMAIIKSYNAEEHSLYKYNKVALEWEQTNISTKFWIYSSNLFYQFISSTFRPGLAILLVTTYVEATFDANKISKFLKILSDIYTTVENIIKILRETYVSLEMAEDISNLIEMVDQTNFNQKVDAFNSSIILNNIYYSIKGKLVLTDASFTIYKGMKCAIIGRNGSGKSSIAKLLLGFDNYQGNILLDDIEITRLNMESYRKLIAYVPQNTSLFNETIYYNLAFGNNKPYSTIIEECKRMGIHDVIMAFPSGYNTCVGEFGNKINGGLRQKIFYTRAFLCDAEIYVFDEPTNNLDEKNSEFLLEYIADPKYANKTFIVICHDMDVVNKFPWIYKFQDGKVFLEKQPSMTGNSLIENV